MDTYRPKRPISLVLSSGPHGTKTLLPPLMLLEPTIILFLPNDILGHDLKVL
jgi:hypothetical protein